jgi:WD40 repeat protein
MCPRKVLTIALYVVTYLCLAGLAIRDVCSVAPEASSEPGSRTLTMRSQIPLHGGFAYVQAAALSRDGRYLAMGGYKNGSSGWVSLWNVTTSQELAAIPGHVQTLFGMAFNRDGRLLASAGDGIVQFWNVAGQSEVKTLRTSSQSYVTAVAFADDNATVATGDERGDIRLSDGSTGREKAILRGHKSAVRCLAFSSDQRTLASGGIDGTVRLWDVITAQELAILRRHTHAVWSVVFAPDGQILASGGEDNTVRLWTVSTRKELVTLRGHTGIVSSLAFSPDGKMLATGGYDRLVRLWEVAKGKLQATVEHGSTVGGHASKLWCVGFAPDGGTLFTCGSDGTVRLWNIGDER